MIKKLIIQIGKFLNHFKTEIVELFSQVVEIAVSRSLLDFDILAIDTVKVRANANYKQTRDLEGLKKEIEKIKNRLQELLKDAEHLDKQEEATLANRLLLLKSATEELKTRNKIDEKETKINITDFDCTIVQQANGEKNTGYCITTAADTKNDIITHFQINNKGGDAASLIPVIKGSEQNLKTKHNMIVADSGFSSIDNLETLDVNEQKALIPDRRYDVENNENSDKGKYDRSHFKYNNKEDYYRCPKRKILKKNASFKKNDRILNQYANPKACMNCSVKNNCTKGRYRVISRDSNEEIKEKMRLKLKKQKNQKKYKKRAHSAESPYGNIKHNKKFRMFMRRGLEKIKMEMALLFMLLNIMKIGKQYV